MVASSRNANIRNPRNDDGRLTLTATLATLAKGGKLNDSGLKQKEGFS